MLVGGIGITALITSYFTGDFILETVYGEDFTQGRMILVALFAYATIQYISSALRSVLIAGGLRGGVFWISLLNLSVTMIFAISWVPEGGAESAGWALAIGQIAQVSVYLSIAFSKLRGYNTRATPPT